MTDHHSTPSPPTHVTSLLIFRLRASSYLSLGPFSRTQRECRQQLLAAAAAVSEHGVASSPRSVYQTSKLGAGRAWSAALGRGAGAGGIGSCDIRNILLLAFYPVGSCSNINDIRFYIGLTQGSIIFQTASSHNRLLIRFNASAVIYHPSLPSLQTVSKRRLRCRPLSTIRGPRAE